MYLLFDLLASVEHKINNYNILREQMIGIRF